MPDESQELLDRPVEQAADGDTGTGSAPPLELTPPEKIYDKHRIQLWRGSCGEVLPQLSGVTGVISDPPWHFHGYNAFLSDAQVIDPKREAKWFHDVWLWFAAWMTMTQATGVRWGWYFMSPDHAPVFLRLCRLIDWKVRLAIPYANQAEWVFQVGEPICTDEMAVRRVLERRGYASVKPVGLILDLIALSRVEPGSTILDPFCGDGSTLEAIQSVPWLQLRGIGIELREERANEAKRRLRA